MIACPGVARNDRARTKQDFRPLSCTWGTHRLVSDITGVVSSSRTWIFIFPFSWNWLQKGVFGEFLLESHFFGRCVLGDHLRLLDPIRNYPVLVEHCRAIRSHQILSYFISNLIFYSREFRSWHAQTFRRRRLRITRGWQQPGRPVGHGVI